MTCADISKAKAMLAYNPQTQLNEGLDKFVKWFESKNKILS